MIAPSRLLVAPEPPDRVVAFGREGTRTRGDLQRDVAALAARLAPLSGGRVLLHCDDAYAFAVGLFGAAHAGVCAVLPPSRQPGALLSLAPSVDALLLDGAAPESGGLRGRPCWHPLVSSPAATALVSPPAAKGLAPLARLAPFVELFTSGTTGTSKPVAKQLRHLEDEVAVLEQCFGAAIGSEAQILATASPQHLYGLLFRVLWPLAAGRPFLRSALLHPEELAPYFEAAQSFVLVTTPVPLRHLVEKDLPELHAGACRAVFASGGPLAAPLAKRASAVFGAAPIELYGSTETGGIALRQQQRGDEPWRPLPGVTVEREPDGRLAVTSPYVSGAPAQPAGHERFVLGDLAELDDSGGFRLLGRLDRVVKIGEKRLALPALEEALVRHPAVSEAAVVPLEQPGVETRVAALLVASEVGRALLRSGGRRALVKALSEHLALDFDRVLLPRAWRIVEALPRDAQGKLPRDRVAALLAETEPALAAKASDASRLRVTRIRIGEDLPFLEGHFPSFPVVAGVVQVHLAMQALAALLGAPPRLARLDALKFHELLRPGTEVQLEILLDEGGTRFELALRDADRPEHVFASGRGMLRGDP